MRYGGGLQEQGEFQEEKKSPAIFSYRSMHKMRGVSSL